MNSLLTRFNKRYASLTPERSLLALFFVIFLLVLLRLFYLQVVAGKDYREQLVNQHYTSSKLDAERGNIFITDKSGKKLQLTENVEYFTLYADPKFILDKKRVVEVLTPIIYYHFCTEYGIKAMSSYECVDNLQTFVGQQLLPEKNTFYTYSWEDLVFLNQEEYDIQVNDVLQRFTTGDAYRLIENKLSDALQGGIQEKNYLWFFENEDLLQALKASPYSTFVDVVNTNYVYILPSKQPSNTSARKLAYLLRSYGYPIEESTIERLFTYQEIRYVRLATNMNAKAAKMIKDAKAKYIGSGNSVDGVPLLHGIGLESFQKRYYPYWTFMAHILGYIDSSETARYGIEEFFDSQLAGKDGKIIGLATPRIGQIGANSFEIEQPIQGNDIYLTIDPVIQKEVESLVEHYQKELRADSVSVLIIEPHTGKIKAMANAPTFNPNEYEKSYILRPITYDERPLLDDLTYVDIPVFLLSWETLRQASIDERSQSPEKKYVFDNYLGPQTFVDKNISFPYEPGSIFKALTLASWIDSDSVGLYEFYNDPGVINVGQFKIANVSKECEGDNTFLHALWFSCNVGMVRIAQKVSKYVFYSYLKKLKFGEKTGIELAGEESGTLPNFNAVSLARFFNNTFGQGILVTPLQMAVAYSALANGGEYIEPTIVEAMYDPSKEYFITLGEKHRRRVFKSVTSQLMKEALKYVVDEAGLKRFKKEWYTLGGKTGTSEIAFRGTYQWGAWRTNGSLMGLVTADNPNYIVTIQVRRPRVSTWWGETAGKIFEHLFNYLIAYDNIDS